MVTYLFILFLDIFCIYTHSSDDIGKKITDFIKQNVDKVVVN